jgi:prepilin-type N-terminal cleavage/methylation domain-containing protein
MSPATGHCARPAGDAFTLIELLVVISIIAILAGLAFPAVQGALGQGKKAQARNDVNQFAAAIKAYQLEYGRLPGSVSGSDSSPTISSVVSALINSNTNNPRGIVFFEPRVTQSKKGGVDTSDNTFYDPWGSAYQVRLDTDYNNRVSPTSFPGLTNSEYFTTVIVYSTGGSTNTKDAISNVK